MKNKIAVIAIHYKNEQQTQGFLEDLSQHLLAHRGVELYIVDNGGNHNGSKFLPQLPAQVDRQQVQVFYPPANLGYFGGANWLLQQKNGLKEYKYIIVCNTDLQLGSQNFFSQLEELSLGAEVATVGPALVSGLSGQDTNPYLLERPTAKKMHFLKWVFGSLLTCQAYQLAGLAKAKLRGLRAPRLPRSEDQKAREVYAVHGGFMIFTGSYFQHGGDFNNPVFLYNEELYVAEFCRRRNLKMLYVPSLQVVHQEHGSVGLLYSRKILEYKAEAATYFANKYWGNG